MKGNANAIGADILLQIEVIRYVYFCLYKKVIGSFIQYRFFSPRAAQILESVCCFYFCANVRTECLQTKYRILQWVAFPSVLLFKMLIKQVFIEGLAKQEEKWEIVDMCILLNLKIYI